MEIIFGLNEIDTIAAQIWQQNKHIKIWLFNAPMGCGKTTFINALCKLLQVNEVSSSPTFSIINEYKSNVVSTIYHLDLYRLKDEEEAISIGIEDVLYSNHYCFIEWVGIAKNLMPQSVCNITIELLPNKKRKIQVDTSNLI
jgi:tRNA threonylcarbamoyladenosine biosynthesis protein TsaE